jgi:hypothetical protein
MGTFKEGQLIIYQNGDSFQIGKIKRICEDGAFVWYHSGDTAARTKFEDMRVLENAYCILKVSLGGENGTL